MTEHTRRENGQPPHLAPAPAPSLYPSPSQAALKLEYVGKDINDIQAPAAIIDAAVVRRNCEQMLDTAQKLEVRFRAHVKTHKITKLQVGQTSRSVNLVCSTVSEIEHLCPWLRECQAQGKKVDVLYGMPITLSAIPRLSRAARDLGEGAIGLFVDHPDHIEALKKHASQWPGPIPVWVNIDVGYHREGVAARSAQLAELARAISATMEVRLAGLYTHLGSSYNSDCPRKALEYVVAELKGLEVGAMSFLQSIDEGAGGARETDEVILSFGATPTATAVRNLVEDTIDTEPCKAMFREIQKRFSLELHAGVYTVSDLQQAATRTRADYRGTGFGLGYLSYFNLGLRILVEVASLYPDRGENPEALIAAGSIVFGRDECKSYSGFGIVTPWPSDLGSDDQISYYDPEDSKTGWIVSRISQEHGMLTWQGAPDSIRPLKLGEKLLIWPNHACIAGASFNWYLVVDSDSDDKNQIQDVWIRWRGW